MVSNQVYPKPMNVGIKGIELYCPNNVVGNEYYMEHFKKQGRDVSGFLDAIGQKQRMIAEHGKETTITLGVKATKRLLEVLNIGGKDIDMIVFTSQFPETTVSQQALRVHDAIGGKEDCICFDMNANCVGMIIATDFVNKFMRATDSVKKAIVIGADYASKHTRDDDTRVYSFMGDIGCAMLLEKSDSDDKWVSTAYTCNSADCEATCFPNCGMSNIYKTNIHKNDKKLTVRRADTVSRDSLGFRDIHKILDDSNLTVDDIKMFCVSQATLPGIEALRKEFNVSEEKMPYVGAKYGYTGTSSPFVALYECIHNGSVSEGDLVLLWSVGSSYQSYGILMRL